MNKQEILSIFGNELFTEFYLEKEATTLSYDSHYSRWVDLIPLKKGDRVLDVGHSHGFPALALFRKEPDIRVVGLEPAQNLLDISKAKFTGKNIGEYIRKYAHNGAVATYIANQHQECVTHKDKISFTLPVFAEDLDKLELGFFNHVICSAAIHWLIDPIKSLNNFNKVLNLEGTISISSAGWKYKPENPELDHNKRFERAPFVIRFYENLYQSLGLNLDEPKNERFFNLAQVNEWFDKTGFELAEYREYRKPLSFGKLLMSCKTGTFFRYNSCNNAKLNKFNLNDFNKLFTDTVLKTMNEIDFLESVENYYDTSPYILARKIRSFHNV